jgi:hypothetical protein
MRWGASLQIAKREEKSHQGLLRCASLWKLNTQTWCVRSVPVTGAVPVTGVPYVELVGMHLGKAMRPRHARSPQWPANTMRIAISPSKMNEDYEDLVDTSLCAWVPPRDWRVGKWGTLSIASYASAFPTAPEPAGLRIYSLTRTATGWATQDGTVSVDLGPVPDPSRPSLVHLPGAARPPTTLMAR